LILIEYKGRWNGVWLKYCSCGTAQDQSQTQVFFRERWPGLEKVLAGARSGVDVAAFALTELRIIALLQEKAAKLPVRILLEGDLHENGTTKHQLSEEKILLFVSSHPAGCCIINSLL